VEIYHHTVLFQTQWLGKRQNGRTERLSKVTVTVEQNERKKEGKKEKGRRPKAKPQGDEWMK